MKGRKRVKVDGRQVQQQFFIYLFHQKRECCDVFTIPHPWTYIMLCSHPRQVGWSPYLHSNSVRMHSYWHVFTLSSKSPAYRWGQQMIDTLFSLFFTLSDSLKEILEFSPMTFWSHSCSTKNKLQNLPHVSEQELWNLSLPVVSF